MAVQYSQTNSPLYINATFDAQVYTLMQWVRSPGECNWLHIRENTGFTGPSFDNKVVDVTQMISAGGLKLRLRSFDDDGTNTVATTDTVARTSNVWLHLAVVRESPTSLKMYVDGALVLHDTTNRTATRVNPALQVMLGHYGSSAGNPGTSGHAMTAAKAWSGTALTVAEVAAELPYRNAQKAGAWGAWHILNTATITTDYSGNGRTLTQSATGSRSDVSDPAGILGDDPAPSGPARSVFPFFLG
jgi:hypothetical protein